MIFDTNALSALAEEDPGPKQEFARANPAVIPVIVLGEYKFGIARSRRLQEYNRWLEGILSVSRVLNVTEETANWYGLLRVQLKEAGTPIPSNDLWIAALSRQYNLPILSRDRHFDRVQRLRRLQW